MPIDLQQRERTILRALVMEHTATGEPVGSRSLVERHDLGISPASVRSVLAHLEELGLAHQPHASAGRVPTQQAFRLYVDHLLSEETPDPETLRALDDGTKHGDSALAIARHTGQVLASRTDAAVLVVRPRAEDSVLAELRFVTLGPGRIVAILRSRGGRIEHRAFEDPTPIEEGDLERLHNYLARRTAGRTLRELRDLVEHDVDRERRALGAAHATVQRWLEFAVALDTEDRLRIEGQERLFKRPEFVSGEKIRAYVDLFESRQRLLELLDRALATHDVAVALGDEAALPVSDVGIVGARCGSASERAGWVAVVGPLRIDYARALPLLRHTARRMAEALDASPGSCDH